MNRICKLVTALCTCVMTTNAMADTISIGNMDVRELKSSYFQLGSTQKVAIEFLLPRQAEEDDNNDFVWILDLDSRQTVWRSRRAEVTESNKRDKLDLYTDEVKLDKGRYGLFFSTHNFSFDSHTGRDIILYGLSALLRDDNRLTHKDIDQLYVDLRAEEIKNIDDVGPFKPFGDMAEVINFRHARKDEYQQYGLQVDKSTEIGIYAIGEISGRHAADGAWLKNTDTGEVLWEMTQNTTRAAGGARKNRLFRDTISIPKGHYVLVYHSDDSHHYNQWNARPPYDPEAWGISVFSRNSADIKSYDPEARLKAQQILAIEGVGDNAFASKQFKLSEPTKIRIYALGERAGSRSMADYGWIVDNSDFSKVWEMQAKQTQHAGGASKNRMVEDVIELPKGKYTVNYVSDNSHSYADGWNNSAPNNGRKWGITLYAAAENFDKTTISLIDKVDGNTLAQIIRIQDSDNRSATFELEKDQKVRVYAIGEGDGDEMADYAYIKNLDSGNRVWNMFADETEHAGGARKNRVSNQVITLKKGKYKVYYLSDGSHSFGDWNANPPTDQFHYGVTVTAVTE